MHFQESPELFDRNGGASMGATLSRVLMVDDDPDLRAMAHLSLTAVGGFEVELCPSGAEALARACSFAPDLVLLDVSMPELDGPTTLGRLRALPCMDSVPIVFMTANTQPSEVQVLLALGAAGVIPKPFDPMGLPLELLKIWESRHG